MSASFLDEKADTIPLIAAITVRATPAYEPADDRDEFALLKALMLGLACVAPFWVMVAVVIAFVVR